MENQQARPSQVDHVNKQLLLRFKQHLDENSFEIPSEAQAIVEVEEASWVDDDEDYDPDDYKPCGKSNPGLPQVVVNCYFSQPARPSYRRK